jgi:TRAP-type C4-dicarboxylate transport system substrate-binding protein
MLRTIQENARRIAPAPPPHAGQRRISQGGMLMKIPVRSCAGLVMAAAVAAAFAAPQPVAAQSATLRFSHWLPPVHVVHRTGIAPWVESVKKASGGSLTIQIFPAQQLGQAKDHYDMAKDGVADITFLNPGYQAGRFPLAGAAELPFLIDDATAGSEVFHKWYAKYAEKEMPEVKLCHAFLFAPGALHSKKQIKVPDDMKGVKGRAAQATLARIFALLGGSSVPVAAPEARDALERGVVELMTAPWGSMLRPWNLDKAVGYTLDMSFYSGVLVDAINKPAYEKLSPAHKKVIDEHCTPEWSKKMAAGWAENEKKGYAEMKAQTTRTVYVPTKAEVKLWRDAMAPITDQWKKSVKDRGVDADTALKELQTALRAAGASSE